MSENEGTYAALMELQQTGPKGKAKATPPVPAKVTIRDVAPVEDLSTTPYRGQNYRFTDDELRWLKHQAFKLSERLDAKVTQNVILRIALAHLRGLYEKNPRDNPLIDALLRFRK